ncbi:TolC family protein [Corallincola luteus]|uniref:TolC family protein n=1 Tax=Corallincola luteus TaxID=1775177 RepID=A0ABY2AFR4_9GAMM|nr:TolC family protein [Corallincola luteus]TCI01277.1 TolC family protein [Corallincola luteus]
MKRMFPTAKSAVYLAVVLAVSGCTTLGPDYVEPDSRVEMDWLEAKDPALSATEPTDPQWWKSSFNDPVLDNLITAALADNLTLRSAGLRVLQAQENLRIAAGQQYPTQTLSGGIGREGLAPNSTGPGVDRNFYSDDLGFGLGWEADVWGRFQRLVESASAELDASVASYDGVVITLLAQVSQTYLNIRTLEERQRYLRDNIKVQSASLTIAEDRYEGGLVTELDPEQARGLLYNSQATLSSSEIALAQLKNNLSLLLGQPPSKVRELLGEPRAIPTAPAQIAIGMPQDLIRRRPDIRQAERQLAAQSAQIGFAITDLYPTFTLGGNIGFASTDSGNNELTDLFQSDSRSWNFGAGFSWNLWNYGRIKGNIRLQDALFQQLKSDYQNSVLSAQAEIENAIVSYLVSQEQLAWYVKATEAAQRSVTLSQVQYDDGLVDFDTVVNNLTALRDQQDLLASTQGAVAINLVDLYKALGGGWQIRTSSRADDLLPEAVKQEMRERTDYWDGVLE